MVCAQRPPLRARDAGRWPAGINANTAETVRLEANLESPVVGNQSQSPTYSPASNRYAQERKLQNPVVYQPF